MWFVYHLYTYFFGIPDYGILVGPFDTEENAKKHAETKNWDLSSKDESGNLKFLIKEKRRVQNCCRCRH